MTIEKEAQFGLRRTSGLHILTPVGVVSVDHADDRTLGYLCQWFGIEAPLHEDTAAVRLRIYAWSREYWLGVLVECARYRDATRQQQREHTQGALS